MRTETEERILKEIDNLLKAGVKFTNNPPAYFKRCDRPTEKEKDGTTPKAFIHGEDVYIFIPEYSQAIDLVDVVVDAGELVDKAIEIKAYNDANPNFWEALRRKTKYPF